MNLNAIFGCTRHILALNLYAVFIDNIKTEEVMDYLNKLVLPLLYRELEPNIKSSILRSTRTFMNTDMSLSSCLHLNGIICFLFQSIQGMKNADY